MVTLENYEEYIISYVDGALNAAELQELEAFIAHHPELRSEMSAYENTRLMPDTSMIYANKEALLKQAPKRTISLGNWRSYGVAAGIIALIGTAILLWQHTNNNHVATIVNVTINKNTAQAPVGPIAHENPIKKDKAIQQPVIAAVNHRKQARPGIASAPGINRLTVNDHQNNTAQPSQEKPEVNKPVEIARITALPEPKTIDTISPAKVLTAVITPNETMVADKQDEKDPFAWLPIDDTKKQGLKDLKKTVDKTVKEVRSVTNNLKETALVFKFGKKEITLNF
ncbi:MAG: hypothetical protein JSS96_03150 [Bacteroidetes bacterium]|nr:hypothetical protein [Bacteroidota bacterium]